MPSAKVAVLIVPRQQFGHIQEYVRHVYENTDAPFEAGVLDNGALAEESAWLSEWWSRATLTGVSTRYNSYPSELLSR